MSSFVTNINHHSLMINNNNTINWYPRTKFNRKPTIEFTINFKERLFVQLNFINGFTASIFMTTQKCNLHKYRRLVHILHATSSPESEL